MYTSGIMVEQKGQNHAHARGLDFFRPHGQIGRMRVVLGSCSAESTRKGGERRVGMGGVAFSLHTYHVVA